MSRARMKKCALKCRLTAWAWFSVLGEKSFVRRVKRHTFMLTAGR